jgi:dienelactone hydrolase
LSPRNFFIRLCLAVVAGLVTLLPAAAQPEFEVQETFLNARIGGRIFRLEAAVTKLKGAEGKLPVALMLHGKDFLGSVMADVRPAINAAQARDLAERGWLVVSFTRRGFGRSDGPFPALVNCGTVKLSDQFDADADETLAAIEQIRLRPDADMSRMIAIGVSAGGAAVLALAARNPPGLMGIVNISGGLNLSTCTEKGNPALVEAVKRFSAQSKVPQLWVYADNDALFPAALVNQMHEAALTAGGNIRRVSYPKLEPNGHNVFGNFLGRRWWLRELDNSLRAWKLPTYRPAVVVDWMKAMGIDAREQGALERYQGDPGNKALAFSPKDKKFYWRFGAGNQKDAVEGAMKDCVAKSTDCRIALEGVQFKAP